MEIPYLSKERLAQLVDNIYTYFYTKEQIDEFLAAAEDGGFQTLVSSTAPETPTSDMIWIYDESATADIVSSEMVVSDTEPTDTSKNPTWIQ